MRAGAGSLDSEGDSNGDSDVDSDGDPDCVGGDSDEDSEGDLDGDSAAVCPCPGVLLKRFINRRFCPRLRLVNCQSQHANLGPRPTG